MGKISNKSGVSELLLRVGLCIRLLKNPACSLREKTRAHRRLVDDVPLEVKNARMRAAVAVYREIAAELNAEFVGTKQLALVEGVRQILVVFNFCID